MLSKISEFVMGFVARFRSEAGQALTEYGLLLALIATVAILALGAVGVAVAANLEVIHQCLI